MQHLWGEQMLPQDKNKTSINYEEQIMHRINSIVVVVVLVVVAVVVVMEVIMVVG